MRKGKIFLPTLLTACVLSFSEAYALMKLEVVNKTDAPKCLFIRPTKQVEGNYITPYTIIVPLQTPKGKVHVVEVDEKQIGVTDYYDVIAAKSDDNFECGGIDPDWNLLAGKCKGLHKDSVPQILIDSAALGLKTTCTTKGK